MIRIIHDVLDGEIFPLYLDHVMGQEYGTYKGDGYETSGVCESKPDLSVLLRLEKELGYKVRVEKSFYRHYAEGTKRDTPWIHSDNVGMVGILFLDGAERLRFWQHKLTGHVKPMWSNPGYAEMMNIDGYYDQEWNCYLEVECKPNSMAIFDASLFHSIWPFQYKGRYVEVVLFTPST